MARPPRWLVVTPVLGALALGAAGAWFYLAQRQYLQQVASANLLAIAQAKLDQIVAWRTERLGDAAVLQESPFFVRAVARWLAGHQPEIAADILTRLRSTKDHLGYDDVRLVDRAGHVVLATSGHQGALDPDDAGALREAFRDQRPTIADVHVSSDDSIPHLSAVAPLFASSARAAEPLGAVVHVVDARRSLFRLVESWPGRSPSAEANLVRRDGDSVLFLTARRFQPGVAPTPRIALSQRDVPAVMAVLGTEGVVRGVDYRGVRVISALRAVPGTPWFLVVKQDEAEALAVWRTRVALVFALLLGLVLMAAATTIAVGQRSATAHYRRLYQAEAALGASEARFRTLVEEAGDGFALLDAEGRFLDVNSACCQQLGYPREELLRLSIADTDLLFSPEQFAADFLRLAGKPPVTYESAHRRKDGTTFPVEVTLSIVPIGGVPQALSLARDITERKRAEEVVRKSQREIADALEFNRSILHTSSIGILVYRHSGQCVFANEAAAKIVGTDVAGLLAQDFHRIQSWKEPGYYDAARKALATDAEQQVEAPSVTTFGRDVWGNFRFSTFHSGDERNLLVFVYDVTERKRAEEALRREHAMLARTEGIAHVGSWEWEVASDTVTWSDELFRIFQRDPREGAPSFAEHPAFYHPDDMARLRQAVEVAVAEGTPYELELRANRKDGETRICVARGIAEMSPGGRAVRLLGSLQDITERKRAEEALRRSEALLNASQELAKVGGWEFDVEQQSMTWTAQLYRLHDLPQGGITPGSTEHIDRSLECYSPEDRPTILRAFQRCAQTGEPYDLEFPFTTFAGRRLWIRTIARAERENGEIVTVVGNLMDITEGKRAEEAMRDSEVRHRTILATAMDGFWLADMTGRFLEVNEAYSRMSGYSRQELLAMRIPDLEATETRTETAAHIEKIRAHGADRFESRHRRKDGGIFDVEISVQFRPMEGGRMVVFVRDITERKRADQALRESEERHRSIIEQLTDVYYRTDRDGCITMMSPSAAPLFGFPSTGEMIGRPIESLWQDPGQRAALLAAIGECGFVLDYEATAVRTDGTPFAIAVSSHNVRDASGAADGVEGIMRDISERKQAEAALRALARHLDSVREEEHTRIARQIHDELGQALTALRLDLTWVGRKLPKGNTALRRRIDAAVALTDETITVGQRIVGELRPPILDDLGLVPAVEWYAQHFAKRSGLRIELDVGAEEPVVPEHLAVTAYRIVQEALTNVVRHAQATHARVRLGEQDGALVIEIRDDGQGMRADAVHSPRSLGIVGMRERAASLGGTVLITSSPGAGTTVRVTFPLERRKERRTPQ